MKLKLLDKEIINKIKYRLPKYNINDVIIIINHLILLIKLIILNMRI